MRTLSIFFIISIFLVLPATILGQNNEISELQVKLSDQNGDDKRLEILLALSEKLFSISQDSAILFGNQARELAVETGDLAGEALAQKYIGLANFYKGDYVESVRNWEAALELFEKIGDKEGIANMLSNLGVIYNNQGNNSRAMELNLRSKNLAEEIGDTVRLVTTLNNIGLIYSGNIATEELGLENFMEALQLSKEASYLEGIGSTNVNIGIYYYGRQNNNVALQYFLESMAAYKVINSPYLSTTLNFLGMIYVGLGDYERAKKIQEESLELATSSGSRLEVVKALTSLAETNFKMGNFRIAIELNQQANDAATEIGSVYEQMVSAEGLARTYEKLSDYISANRFLNTALVLKDTLYSERNQEQLNNLRVKYEIDNILQEKEVLETTKLLLEEKGRQQRIVNLLLILGVVSVSSFMISLYRLNKQRKKANEILEQQNILITGQKKEITDSIVYASRIQNAVLTPVEEISKLLPDHFILYRPRDIVSGDFYWITKINNKTMCVVADSTGHGVPGAFMSMLGIAFLNEIISRNPDINANELLNELRNHIIDSLRQRGRVGDTQDGMDLAAIIIDKDNSIIEYAGANNPLLLFRNCELIEFKPDKMPIGIHERADQSFTNHVIKIQKDDVVYAFSDGFPDQFGGPNGKKFMVKNLKRQLAKLHTNPMQEQKVELEIILDKWMGEVNQIDDILVMGIRF